MKLTPKRRAFVRAYTGKAKGNASEAARIAGYAHPAVEGCRLLRFAEVQQEIAKLGARAEREAWLTGEQIRERLTGIAEDAERDADRIKALDMLAKMRGLYLPERLEVSGPGGGPVRVAHRLAALSDEDLLALAADVLRRKDVPT